MSSISVKLEKSEVSPEGMLTVVIFENQRYHRSAMEFSHVSESEDHIAPFSIDPYGFFLNYLCIIEFNFI